MDELDVGREECFQKVGNRYVQGAFYAEIVDIVLTEAGREWSNEIRKAIMIRFEGLG
jgi:hypothetical protein